MKKKLLTMTAMALMLCSAAPAMAFVYIGTATWPGDDPAKHELLTSAGFTCNVTNNMVSTLWMDPGMWVATGLDLAATGTHGGRIIDAKKAIKQLKKALGEEEGGGGSGNQNNSTNENASAATVYAPEMVLTQLNITNKDGATVFNSTREAIEDFLYKTVDTECSGSARDCNVIRQNKWLLASVTMAAATSDKILSLTANQERVKNISKKGSSTLIKHFQQLAKDFNGQTTPAGMYNIMAEMVLDTHRQVNEANVLMARDLEMQGLSAVRETEVTGLSRSGSNTEG